MKVDFGIIVLNAEDFIEHTIKGVYEEAHKIIIIEGAALDSETGKCLVADKRGLSTDKTVDIINSIPDPDNKIIYDRAGFIDNKDELSNRYLDYADCDYIWQLDGDEVYEKWVLKDVIEFLNKNPDIVCVDFIPWHFFRDFRHVGSGSFWDHSFRRVFKYVEGSKWKTHAPPILMWPDHDMPVHECGRIADWGFTKSKGWHLYHYSHVTEKQVTEKQKYHSYRGYYRPNWVNRIWKNAFDEDMIKKCGSHPFDETKLHSYAREGKGRIDFFLRKHPKVMESHLLYKKVYGGYKNPLNIAHLIESWGAGGGCRCPYTVAKKMAELFGDTHEFIASIRGVDPNFSVKNSFMINKSSKEVAHYIKRKGFDLVNVEWWNKDKEKFKEIRRYLYNIPFIATFHINPIAGTEWDVSKNDISWFDGVVVTSSKMLKLEQFKDFSKCSKYVNSPCDAQRFFNVELQPHSGFNVIISSSYNDGKFRRNTFDIINRLVAYGDVVVHFIGVTNPDGDYAKSIRKRFPNHDRIQFVGYVDTAEYFRSMDLAINLLPDRSYATSECFLQEAMAVGLPTIKLGGLGSEDLVINGIDGYITKNEREFFDCFKALYKSKKFRKRMGDEATSTIESVYTPEKSAKKLRSFYLKILGMKNES